VEVLRSIAYSRVQVEKMLLTKHSDLTRCIEAAVRGKFAACGKLGK
jgi:hypothetical protein